MSFKKVSILSTFLSLLVNVGYCAQDNTEELSGRLKGARSSSAPKFEASRLRVNVSLANLGGNIGKNNRKAPSTPITVLRKQALMNASRFLKPTTPESQKKESSIPKTEIEEENLKLPSIFK